MKKLAKNLLTTLLVFALTASLISAVYSQESSDKAKQILEKTVKKYTDMIKESGDMKSFAAKLSIKGGGQIPMGGGMPLGVDIAIEIYVAKPHNLYLDLSGNLGNATVVVGGKEEITATIMLSGTKQFATMAVPIEAIKKIQEEADEEDPEKPEKMEELWEALILGYEGTENVKAGKAHKITITPRDSAEKGSIIVYILDGKWDPARIEIVSEKANGIIEFDMLEINAKISDDRFVPNTAGYTPISEKDLKTALMMLLMTAMMQQNMPQ